MPDAPYKLPYEGVKGMLLADDIDLKELLRMLFSEMYDELPPAKKKK